MSNGTLISIGSINADFQMRTARRVTAGDTFIASDFVRLSGGKAANVAFLAHRLGCATTLIGRVGNDDLKEQALANLRRNGVSLTNVTSTPHVSTAVAMIAVPPDGKKTIVLANNANDAWDDESVQSALEVIRLAPKDSILVADFEIPGNVVRRCLLAAKSRLIKVIIDPSPPERIDRVDFRQFDVITPNAQEASALAGVDATSLSGAAKAALKLGSFGVKCVCVKLIEGGCVLYCDSALVHIPAIPIEVVDATGAGDAFTCAFAVSMIEGKNPNEAAIFATSAAHVAVTSYGSQESYPDRQTIERLAQSFRVEVLNPKYLLSY